INLINHSLTVVDPSIQTANEFILLVNRSKMLITNWVYLQTNSDDKDALETLHDLEYPKLKNDINELFLRADDTAQVLEMDTIFRELEELLEIEQELKIDLTQFEDDEAPIKKFMVEETISEEILPRSSRLINELEAYRDEIALQKTQAELNT